MAKKSTAIAEYKAGIRAGEGLRRHGRFRHHKKSFQLPLAVIGGFIPLGIQMYDARLAGGKAVLETGVANLTGYNMETHTWSFDCLARGLIPILGGYLIHKFVGGKLGVNRAISRMGIPLIRI